MMTTHSREEDGLGPARTGLVVLAVAVFAAVTTELLPVGLLSQISASVGITESTCGLLVSAFAVMVTVLSVPLSFATRRLPRKPVLLATLAGYVLSNLVVAIAPTFGVLVAGRVIGGIAHSLFFSVCIGYATRLVPPNSTGRALALASVGVSGGLILGVPLSTALGSALGWRAAFGCLCVVAGLVLVGAALVLPPVTGATQDRWARRGQCRNLALVVTANGLTYWGTYVLYTYVSVLLLHSGESQRWVGPTLLLFGLCGLLGLRAAAPRLDQHARKYAILVPALMACGTCGVALGFPRLVLVVAAAVVWLAALGPAASLYQAASIRTAASLPETAGAWINASSNAGIGGGAAVGDAIVSHAGLTWNAWSSAAILASSAVLAGVARHAFPPPGEGPLEQAGQGGS